MKTEVKLILGLTNQVRFLKFLYTTYSIIELVF